jgi:predicted ribosome quality control (RQC) complex YloA/Tae2 family protein
VLLPNSLSIGLEVYAQRQRYHLIASAHADMARIHLVHTRPSRGVEQATPLLLLLRKYVLGGRISAIDQPPLERILILSIVKEARSRNHRSEGALQPVPDAADAAQHEPTSESAHAERMAQQLYDDADEGDDAEGQVLRCELIVEPMGRRSNIILVDENNVILESVKRVTPRMSSRVILPREPYEMPPAQEKRDPHTVTAQGIQALRTLAKPDLVRSLVAGYKGVSPQVAHEVAYRALGNPNAEMQEELPWSGIADHMRDLFGADWEPTLVPGDGQPLAYAPYALTYLQGALPQSSMSTALETFYAAREGLTAHQQHREAVQRQLDAARERLQHQYTQIVAELERIENVEHLRWEGEMILAFLHAITPGQTTLDVEGHTISLDPEHSPLECAQARFRTYNKAKTGRERLQEQEQGTRAQLDGLEHLAALLAVADEREQIDQLAQEAREQGYISERKAESGKKQRRIARRKPLHLVSSDGFDIYVGRSTTQNVEVTFRIGRPDDVWLHIRNMPGAHVIVRSNNREVPERTLQEAAGLAVYFSRARGENAAEVDMAHRRHVRKVSGGPPGLVTYRAEGTLLVPPLPPWT